jgi:hypothetical protein
VPNRIHASCIIPSSCKRGEMHTYAYEFFMTERGKNFDSVTISDEDVYVLPDNLKRVISRLAEPARKEKKIWTDMDCVYETCRGICGGPGYFMSRETVIAIEQEVDRSKYPNFRDETKEWDAKCGRWGDVTIAMVYTTMHNVQIVQFPKGSGYYNRLAMTDQGVWNALKRSDTY